MISVANAEEVGDMNADDQVDAAEAIISLKVATGLETGVSLGTYIPATGNAAPKDVFKEKTFSNSASNGLTDIRSPASPAQTGQEPVTQPGPF